jgi:hypothetical protein
MRGAPVLAALSLTSALGACGGGHSSAGPPVSTVAPATCPDGFALDTARAGCLDITPATDCPPGTRAALGSSSCQPVGWTTACPTGFAPDPSGWGCHEILPATACTGATFESLGSATCQSIGDCSAPFPPASAMYFVDASFTPAQTDAKHFTSIGAALAAAPPGAVVSVDAGTYAESVNVTAPVSIVGRCAAKVILEGPIQSTAGPRAGFQAGGVSGTVAIRGFTIKGFDGGIVEQSSTVTVDGCLLTENTGGGVVAIGGVMNVTRSRIFGTVGVAVPSGKLVEIGAGAEVQDGAKLQLTQVALVQNMTAGVAVLVPSNAPKPGDVKLTQSVVLGTVVRSDTHDFGFGVDVEKAGTVEIANSAIVGNHAQGVGVAGSGTAVTITDSVARDSVADKTGLAVGVAVGLGGSATIDSSMIAGSSAFGLYATGTGSKLTVSSSVVRGTSAAGDLVGMGIAVNRGATLSLTNVAVAGTRDTGVGVDDQATATIVGSLVRDTVPFADPTKGYAFGTGVSALFGGKLVLTDSTVASATHWGVVVGSACDPMVPTNCGGTAALTKVLVLSTQPDANGEAVGLQAEASGQATVDSSVFAGNYDVAMVVTGTGTSATVTNSVLRGTGLGTTTPFGYGLLVLDGATASLASCFVRDNLGVALAFSESSPAQPPPQARIDSTLVFHNQVGVYASHAMLEEVATQPDTLGGGEIAISQSQFIDNVTRVSADELPIPTLSELTAPPPSP